MFFSNLLGAGTTLMGDGLVPTALFTGLLAAEYVHATSQIEWSKPDFGDDGQFRKPGAPTRNVDC